MQNEFKEYKIVAKKEDTSHKELFDQVRKGQEAVAKEVTRLQEENRKLREELENRTTPEKVLKGFRGNPAYFTELNDKAVEKIKLCWDMALSDLVEFPGGPIDGFIKRYISLEEEIHRAKLASGTTDATNLPDENAQLGLNQPEDLPPPDHSLPENLPPAELNQPPSQN